MKIGAIEIDGKRIYGSVEEDEHFYPFDQAGVYIRDLAQVIAMPELNNSDTAFNLAQHTLIAPVGPLRKNIFCVGKNYIDHSLEFAQSGFDRTSAQDIPENPIIFSKACTTVAGPGQDIPVSCDPTGTVDYEGELGVIIGKYGKNIRKEDAYAHVFGYTIINDLTSRELQRRHTQWFIGKNLDLFCPIGPWIVTADEMGPLDELNLSTHVNGERRQFARINDLIFDIPTILSTLSAYLTLEPGDVIATGTPVGVGIGFKPPKYLKPGDVVEISIDNIGVLKNTMI